MLGGGTGVVLSGGATGRAVGEATGAGFGRVGTGIGLLASGAGS